MNKKNNLICRPDHKKMRMSNILSDKLKDSFNSDIFQIKINIDTYDKKTDMCKLYQFEFNKHKNEKKISEGIADFPESQMKIFLEEVFIILQSKILDQYQLPF